MWGGDHRGDVCAMGTEKCHVPLFKVQKLGKIHGEPKSHVLALASARVREEQEQSWQTAQPVWMSPRLCELSFWYFSVLGAEAVPDPARKGIVLGSSPCRRAR